MCGATLVVYLYIHRSIQSFFNCQYNHFISLLICRLRLQVSNCCFIFKGFNHALSKKSRKSTINFIPVRLSVCSDGIERQATERFSLNFKFGNLTKIWCHLDLVYSRTKIRHFTLTLNPSLSSPNMNDFRDWQRLCSLWGKTWGWRLSNTQHPGSSMISIY
jgi:hypothetical protein